MRRKLIETGMLALLLAQEGVQVLVHGMPEDPGRVTTAEIFHDLGLPIGRDADDVAAAWRRREPVYMQTDALCPPLARLLDARWTIGLRNSGHTVAKLLDPCPGRSVRVVAVTHPEYLERMDAFLRADGGRAMLLRGTEGEIYANPRRQPTLTVYRDGAATVAVTGEDGGAPPLDGLPATPSVADNVAIIRAMLDGRQPVPEPIRTQVDTLAALAREP